MEKEFLQHINVILEEHLSEERFGVSELAREAGMSRSSLLRKISRDTGMSASRYIRKFRLDRARMILKEEELSINELSYRVGFSSPSYFVKCFREQYGHPPGELAREKSVTSPGGTSEVWPVGGPEHKKLLTTRKAWKIAAYLSLLLIPILLLAILLSGRESKGKGDAPEKSIAVLPFRNNSSDSSNVYFINGLMESVLGNLQKIEDLRVVSRTSVEKFRNRALTAPEIARELKVSYLVEGSGQKVGDGLMLNIQLIEAASDRHLWSRTYRREMGDIFSLQLEISQDISREIHAVITPEEAARIEKAPTRDLEAYDLFLQGLEQFRQGTREGLEAAVILFGMAIEKDPGFARAYADKAIVYAILDMYRLEKQFTSEIGRLAEKAMELDSTLAQSLVARAMYHISLSDHMAAIPYLERALAYNPNSALVINILADFYNRFIPDTQKYLEYSLRAVDLDIASREPEEASLVYLHLGNAFIQSGFVTQAEKYIALSLDKDPENSYSQLLWIYIQLARSRDLERARGQLALLLESDTTRHDILKELGVLCYYQRDYAAAHQYFSKMFDLARAQGLDLYKGEKLKMALVLSELDRDEESGPYLDEYLDYARSDRSVYKHLSLSAYSAFTGDLVAGLEHMELFSEEDKYPYWYIFFLDMDDPLFDEMSKQAEFQAILQGIKVRFWAYHQELRSALEEKGLI